VETVLRRPDYRDENPYDPLDVLTPLVLREFLQVLQGYEPAGNGVRPLPQTLPAGAAPGDYVRLSDFRGRKPVLLVMAHPTDSWTWHWMIAPMVEMVRQACGDRLEVFAVCTTIHDSRMGVKNFFGDPPDRQPWVHEWSLEQRAFACKTFYMDRPHFGLPYLLDDMAQGTRNAYRDDGGGAYMFLVDLDGRLAYVDCMQDLPPTWGKDGVSFYDEFVYIRMNHLESRVAGFFANGCRYGKSMETPYPAWRRPSLLERAEVVRVDGDRLVVKHGGRERAFLVPATARVEHNYAPSVPADLPEGEKVDVSYVPPADAAGDALARWVSSRGRHEEWRGREPTMWVAARVVSYDAQARVLAVERVALSDGGAKGLAFWRGAGDRATAFDPRTTAKLAAVSAMAEQEDDARAWKLHVDDAVDIFRDGRAVGAEALQPGDPVGVLCRAWQAAGPGATPLQVRAYGFAR
jgi:hypothetical protein